MTPLNLGMPPVALGCTMRLVLVLVPPARLALLCRAVSPTIPMEVKTPTLNRQPSLIGSQTNHHNGP